MTKNITPPVNFRLAFCTLAFSLLAGCSSSLGIRPDAASAAPDAEQAQRRAYVDSALKIVREHALFADRVDWPAAERRLHAAAMTQPNTYALYGDLDWLLQQLRDNHSFLQLDDEAAQGYLSAKGAAFKTSGVHPKAATRFRDKRTIEARDEGRIRWVTVPSMSGDEAAQHAYAGQLAGLLGKQPAPCGIVLDFRGNGGGNMWPMLAGLSPLFATATMGAFVEPSARTEIAVRSGALVVTKDGAEQQVMTLDDWRSDSMLQGLPVAILLDGATGSSGEIVPLLLSARPRVRTFGQATYGASTSTEGFPLSDGANLVIVTSGVADAAGTLHMQGLTPDQSVAFVPEVDRGVDPDAAAAKAWLAGMRCR